MTHQNPGLIYYCLCSPIFILFLTTSKQDNCPLTHTILLYTFSFSLPILSPYIFLATVMDSSTMQSHQSASVAAQEAFQSQFDLENPLAAMNSYAQYVIHMPLMYPIYCTNCPQVHAQIYPAADGQRHPSRETPGIYPRCQRYGTVVD